jgi:hypothetical protein
VRLTSSQGRTADCLPCVQHPQGRGHMVLSHMRPSICTGSAVGLACDSCHMPGMVTLHAQQPHSRMQRYATSCPGYGSRCRKGSAVWGTAWRWVARQVPRQSCRLNNPNSGGNYSNNNNTNNSSGNMHPAAKREATPRARGKGATPGGSLAHGLCQQPSAWCA